MLHLAVASFPRDFGGVEDCLFRCSPIDNLITLCQVKSNCPKQWKSQESHLCQHSTSDPCVQSFSPASSSCLPLPRQSISSQLNEIQAFYWITTSESRCDIFFPPLHISILAQQPLQSNLWIKCGKSGTGSPLKYYWCIISSQKIKSMDK